MPNLSTVVKVSSSRQARLQSAVTWQSMSKQAMTVAMTVARKFRSAVAMRAFVSASLTEGAVTWGGVAFAMAPLIASRCGARLGSGREAAAAAVEETAVAGSRWRHAAAEPRIRFPDGGGPDTMAMSESAEAAVVAEEAAVAGGGGGGGDGGAPAAAEPRFRLPDGGGPDTMAMSETAEAAAVAEEATVAGGGRGGGVGGFPAAGVNGAGSPGPRTRPVPAGGV
ncbi:MAG: hypothetical protein GY772_15300 [bacterium]|nr:hypothetical protein [bacterium]